MPKEQFIINEFGGAVPATGGANAMIRFSNARVDTPNSVAVPENADVALDTSTIGCTLIEKKMYVDGQEGYLRVLNGGIVTYNDAIIGYISQTGVPQVDVIGRQAIISNPGSSPKFVRISYPGAPHINFNTNDIIFEDDYISGNYMIFGEVKDLIALNATNFLILYSGSTSLTMLYRNESAWVSVQSAIGVEDEIVAMSYDIDTYLDTGTYHGYVNKVYCAYYIDSHQFRIREFDISLAYPEGYTNDATSFNSAAFEETDRWGHFVTISTTVDIIPSEFKVCSLAITNSKIFIGFNRKVGAEFGLVGLGNTLLSSTQDLLFCIDKPTLVNNIVSELVPSSLPWNPYKKQDGRSYEVLGGHVQSSPNNNDFWIPEEMIFEDSVYDSIVDEWLEGGGWTNNPDATPWMGWFSFPGNCGIRAEHIIPIGDLAVLNYDGDTVGYLVKSPPNSLLPKTIPSTYEGWQLDTTEGIPDNWNNGCGYLETHSGITLSLKSERTTSGYCVEDNTYTPHQNYVLFCWNGISIGDHEWEWTIRNSETVPLTKHFDDDNTTNYPMATHHRFALFPEINNVDLIDGCDGCTGNLFNIGNDGTIHSVVLFNTSPPISCNGESFPTASPHNFMPTPTITGNIGVGYKNRISPDNASIFVKSKRPNIWYNTIDIEYGPLAIGLINPGATTKLNIISDALTAVPYSSEEVTAFVANNSIRYKLAFIYDGTSISPLSDRYITATSTDPNFYVELKITMTMEQMQFLSKRVTAVNIYRALVEGEEEIDLYRLVQSFELTNDVFDLTDGVYTKTYSDYNSTLASFNAEAGYSETARTVSVGRRVQCVCNNYLFVGNVTIDNRLLKNINTDNLVIRSLPFQPSVFNYQEEFAVLPFTPLALVPFNGRVYCFGNERYAILAPDSLAIEQVSNLCGIADRNHAVATDYGIFVYYSGNVYHIDGAKATPIGDAIRINPSGGYSETLDLLKSDIFVGYIQKRNAIFIIGKGEEYIYIYAYSLSTNKWATYTLTDIGSRSYPISIYDKDDTAVYVLYDGFNTRRSIPPSEAYNHHKGYSLFSSNDVRTMLLKWQMNIGDPNQSKYVYSIKAYDGNNLLSPTITIDDQVLSGLGDGLSQKQYKQFNLSVEYADPISQVRILLRRMVQRDDYPEGWPSVQD